MMSSLPSLSRAAAWLALAGCSAAAWAQTPPGAARVPDRLNAYVAFAPIDGGAYHVIVLSPRQDPSIHDAKPLDFCAREAGYATVRNVERLPYRDELASVIGCWEAAGAQDPLSSRSSITVKFFSPTANRVREFTVNGGDFRIMSFDWRTEQLFALTGAGPAPGAPR